MRRLHRQIVGLRTVTVYPGETKKVAAEIQQNMDECRLLMVHRAGAHELRFLVRKTGGSKRKGRRASWLWVADVLAERQRPSLPAGTIDSLTVGAREYLCLVNPLPLVLEFAAPITLGRIRAGVWVSVTISNKETSRSISIAGSIIGTVYA